MAGAKDLQSKNCVEEQISLVGLSPGLTVGYVTSVIPLAYSELQVSQL